MYNKQLITTEDAVIIMPGIVLRHPVTSITEDGQNTYIRSVFPMTRTPATRTKAAQAPHSTQAGQQCRRQSGLAA